VLDLDVTTEDATAHSCPVYPWARKYQNHLRETTRSSVCSSL